MMIASRPCLRRSDFGAGICLRSGIQISVAARNRRKLSSSNSVVPPTKETGGLRQQVTLLATLMAIWAGVASAAPAFPISYSADKHYLIDRNGAPFPILGRTSWFVVSLPKTDYRIYIDDTVYRGYNAIEFHVINHDPRGAHPPFDGNGDAPFLKQLNGASWNGELTYGSIHADAPDLTTPNESYWSFVDGLLAYCERKGILVFMFPAYVGYAGGGQGWMKELVANGPAKTQSYGAWIATRYRNQTNIVWMMGGDMGTGGNPFNTEQTNVEHALLAGLKSVSGQQSASFSAEWTSESIATDQMTFGGSMTLNGAYSWSGDVNTQGRRAYGQRPAFLLEEPYDEEGPDGNGVNASATQPVRRFQWWGWLSTIGGYISGNGYVWPFPLEWRSHLDTPGTRDMARLNDFIKSLSWFKLAPSGLGGMRTLITSGNSSTASSSYIAAAAAADGTLLVAYNPPKRTGAFSVDMGAMSGPARARWFDPTTATYRDAGSGLANSGSRSFTPPGKNGGGENDWVLVLDHGTLRVLAPPK
jgi:hypothetical protein